MGGQTAKYIVDRIRSRVGMFDRTKLRDGFSTDDGQADIDILSFLNDGINELLMTGYHKCRFSLPVVSGTAEYAFDAGIAEVLIATYQGVELEKTRLTTLYRNQNLPLTASGKPTKWYNDIPDTIGLYPTPDTTDTGENSLEIIAESLATTLALPTDVPDRLPAVFHPRLMYGPAYQILLALGGSDPSTMAKIENYQQKWGKLTLDVEAMANNRQQDEVYQMAPDEYRVFYIYQNANGV